MYVASRKLENCEEAAQAIRDLGRCGRALRADVAEPDDVERLVESVLEESGRIDVLVNNAGVAWSAPTLDYPIEGWDRVFATNVRGLWLLSQRVARHMRERGGGSLIQISSISAYKGDWEEAQPVVAYNASKGAVVSLTRDLAVKLAPFGIRVNGIAPGPFMTDMMSHIRDDPKKLREFEARVPLGRSGAEDDVKGVAVFLASDASAFVTGHTLVVDGGKSCVY